MKGYKALNKDMTAYGGFKYELEKTYHMDGEIKPCARGFHFCKSIPDCYNFYCMNDDTIICEVDASGEIKTEDNIKFVTNEITIIAVIEGDERKGNSGKQNTGYCNTGDHNMGNWNTGSWNRGKGNAGWRNAGNWNIGDDNPGNCNTGSNNAGDRNTGCWNTGDWNTGCCNAGESNTGDWNTGNCNTGCFCENDDPRIMMFDEPSAWTIQDWYNSRAYNILFNCPITRIGFENGVYKVIVVTKDDRQKWWDELSDSDKQECFNLPNFNADKFCRCIGIKHI